jgi:type III secretion protein J
MTATYHPVRKNRGLLFVTMMLLAMLLALSGCSQQDLYANQSEEQANEMIAVLSEGGITAGKAPGEEGTWNVTVDQGDFAKGVELLRARGLPREKFASAGDLFKQTTMGDTTVAQHARLIFSQEQELNRMISQFDGVVSAQVKLAMPQPNALGEKTQATSASVLVKHRTGFDLRSKSAAIKSLVANGVEGLAYDNVSVVIEPAQQLPIVKADEGMINVGTLLQVIMGILALGLLFLGFRAYMRRKRRARTEIVTEGTAE